MVADKINYRNTGPKTLLTHQPTQGRGNEGGLRIGEMERDALLAHGMSKFLTESLMERADKTTIQVNKETGRIGTSRETLDMPYSMALFTQELEAMHVTVRLETASAPPTTQESSPQTSTEGSAPKPQSDGAQAPQ